MPEKGLSGKSMVRVEHLCKDYKLYKNKMERISDTLFPSSRRKIRLHNALKDVSLQVNKGETIGIIGVNREV